MSKKRTTVRVVRVLARASTAVAPALAARMLEQLFLTPLRRPVLACEQEWMAGAQRGRVRFDDARELPTYAWGAGPTMLLVHGWSGRGSQLCGFVAPLVERGFRVVTFDAPGHGAADGRLSGLPELADAVQRVAAAVAPVRGILAHSLGTAAVTISVSRGLPVERLVYLAPPDDPGEYLARAARHLGFGEEVTRLTQARIERRFAFPFERARGTTLAQALTTPLLVLHDASDHEVPRAEGARLVARWPGAVLVTTEGLGHQRILRDPEVIDAAAGFLGINAAAKPSLA